MFGPYIFGGFLIPSSQKGYLCLVCFGTPRTWKPGFSCESWSSHDDVMMTLGSHDDVIRELQILEC